MYDDLFSLTLCKKLLKTFKKNCFNSHDGWEKTLYLGIAAEGYRQNTELSRCIFQISLKYIELVIPKILFILVLCRFNFYFKIMLTPPPPTKLHWPSPQQHNPPNQNKNFWSPQQKDFSEIWRWGGVGGGGGVDAMKSPEWLDLFNLIFCTAIHHHNWNQLNKFLLLMSFGKLCWCLLKSNLLQ